MCVPEDMQVQKDDFQDESVCPISLPLSPQLSLDVLVTGAEVGGDEGGHWGGRNNAKKKKKKDLFSKMQEPSFSCVSGVQSQAEHFLAVEVKMGSGTESKRKQKLACDHQVGTGVWWAWKGWLRGKDIC